MSRAVRAAWWLLPPVLLVLLYAQPGLDAWFQQDDFAWLGQHQEVHSWRDLPRVLFQPRAQGTIRTWSERVFFLAMFDRFGLDARPYHWVVWCFQAGAMALMQSIVWRVTGSAAAGLAAPIVWICGLGLATPLVWLSSWNQVLCGFFFLAGLRILIQACETDTRAWWALHWTVFILGFGALEIHVVYPALALAWVLFEAPRHWKKVAPMFAVSGLYALVHQLVAAKPKEGVYAMHWDASMIATGLRYWSHALAGGLILPHWDVPGWLWKAGAWLLGGAALAFCLWAWRRGERLAAYGAWWFTAVIGPVLPLRDHFSPYYLGAASAGLALLWAAAAAAALRANRLWRGAALLALAVHLALCWPVNRATVHWLAGRGQRTKVLVEGLERAHQLHPGKTILLSGVDGALFWSGVYDRPQRIFGAPPVLLVPGSEKGIREHPELGELSGYIAAPAVAARALARGGAVVYQVEGTRLRNITRAYRRRVPEEWRHLRPRWIDAGQEVYQPDLGEGWYANEGGYRWMGRRAVVRLQAPGTAGERFFVQGYRPAHEPPAARVTLRSGETVIGELRLEPGTDSFDQTFPLPQGLEGRPEFEVTIEVDRVVKLPGDGRELGLAFGRLGLK
jgi:hypothetical protein